MGQKKIQSVMVILNGGKADVGLVRAQLARIFKAHGVTAQWRKALAPSVSGRIARSDLSREKVDMVLVGGGDGTMLETARRIMGSDVPLLGINLGSLGFLTSVRRDELEQAVPKILAGHYRTSDRMALEVKVFRKRKLILKAWALNEAVVFRGAHAQMIGVNVLAGGEILSRYLCDGMIVSTPTGSTAYCLSAGGPILSPGTRALALVPICAHALTNRPIVVEADEGISIQIPLESPEMVLQTDGRPVGPLFGGDEVRFGPAAGLTRLVHLPEIGFYTILRQKLKWSGTNI
jgi:NAD+ kinase